LQYAENNEVDVAFLDVEMPGMNGLELAGRLRELRPSTNIIFVTGYEKYSLPAFSVRASGFLVKPFTTEDIAAEMKNLRVPVKTKPGRRVYVKCFGSFEVFIDGEPLRFPRQKAKEIFAYLVYKEGAASTIKEIAAAVLEDKKDGNIQVQIPINSMVKAFEGCGEKGVLIKRYNSIAVDTEKIDCDYYRCLEGDEKAEMSWAGEFMTSYGWAEHIAGYLDRRLKRE